MDANEDQGLSEDRDLPKDRELSLEELEDVSGGHGNGRGHEMSNERSSHKRGCMPPDPCGGTTD